jgi:5-methylcytosine-specific restriction endonuclease McrA
MRKQCNRCQCEVDALVEEQPETSIHYAKAICTKCGRFIDWLKKPEHDGKRTSSKFTSESLRILCCELCGRGHAKLGKRSTLDIHHKIPIEEGGKDERDNILVLCTACHRMAHFLRTYLHRHLDDFYTFYDRNGK